MSDTDPAPPSTHELHVPGLPGKLHMQVHAANDVFISRSIAEQGIWEADETRFLLEILRPGQVFVDVGANIGYFTLIASALVGEAGKVLAFEPEADNFNMLEENCRLNQCANVSCFDAALGIEDAEETLYLSETNQGDHSILRDEGSRTQDIRVLNGSLAIGAQCERVDCIKIDTQGYECHVIRGLKPLIAASLPGLVMLVEFSPVRLQRAGTSGRELLAELQQFDGLHLYLMDHRAGGLLPMSIDELNSLTSFTEQNPVEEEDNLIISGRPLESLPGFPVLTQLGIYENTLAYLLLGDRLEPWEGESCDVRELQTHFYLPEGWAFPEDWGRWSLGDASRIKFLVGDRLRQLDSPRLRVRARYFGDVSHTGLQANGVYLGDFDLRDAVIPLPASVFEADHVTLTFRHADPQRPCDLGDSNDDRLIKLGLETLAIEGA